MSAVSVVTDAIVGAVGVEEEAAEEEEEREAAEEAAAEAATNFSTGKEDGSFGRRRKKI